MSTREAVELRILEDFRCGKIGRRQAAQLLGVSERAVTRRSKKLRVKGIAGIKHGNTGNAPVNRRPEEERVSALEVLQKTYFDFNLKHAWENLRDKHGFQACYSTFHGWCRASGIAHRRRRRTSEARLRRERMANEGLMLQMDGSHHAWNGRDKWCLIGLIDDATSDIPAARFFETETTAGCMAVLREVIERRGIPWIIYTDKAGWAGGSEKRQSFPQFVRACEELGIRVITTSSAEAKGRIERAWRTCQDRLVPEFRLHGITSMLDGNRYLNQVFLPEYWRVQNTVVPRDEASRYRPAPKHLDLDQIFCTKHWRTVRSDNTVSFENRCYRILDTEMGSLRQKDVAIHIYADGSHAWYFGNIRLNTEKVRKPIRRWAANDSSISIWRR